VIRPTFRRLWSRAGLGTLLAAAGSIPAPGQGPAPAEVTVLEDTLIRVMTNEPVDSRRAGTGAALSFTVSEDVLVNGARAIPRGATVHGTIVRSKKAGVLNGRPALTLKLVSLELGGRNYPLYSYQLKVTGTSKTASTETTVATGAAVGAIVGASVASEKGGISDSGHVASASAGAVVGAGVGTIVAATSSGPGISIPAEAQVDFYLAAPITVAPVSAPEAAKLAEGLHSGGPRLYVRGETP
jgi:hypothetical protein